MRRALLPCLVLAASVIAACGSSGTSKGNGDVILWHGYDQEPGKAIKAAVADFNATNPGFKVNARYAGQSDDALAKTLTALTAGNYPDIVYLFGSDMPTIARNPKIVTWDAYVKSHPDFNVDDFFPAARKAATVNGKLAALPALVDNLCIVYNKKLFKEAGVPEPTADWTWDDFRAAAKKLTIPSKQQFGWAYPISGDEDTTWRYEALLWQAGGDILTPDNSKAAFNSPAGVKALTLLQQMAVQDKSVYTFSTANADKYLNLFNGGKIAMLWTGPWDLGSFNSDVDYGVQILPADQTHASISGPDMWVTFNRGEKNVANAQKFLADFTSAKTHLKYAIQTGDLPVRVSETQLPDYKNVYLKKFPQAAVFVQNLEQNITKARPAVPEYPGVSKAIGEAVVSVILGKAQPAEALKKAEEDANAALAGG